MMYADFRIAVIGDYMLDEWWRAESIKISPEAPVLDIINPVLVTRRAGGAGNVAKNLLALGAKVDCYGIIGDDSAGCDIRAFLCADGAVWMTDAVAGFATHKKIRYVVDGQMVMRISMDASRTDSFRSFLDSVLAREAGESPDAVIVSDYNKGTMTKNSIEAIMISDVPVFVDPKFDNLQYYAGAELIKFNKAEAEVALAGKGYHSIATIRRMLPAANVVVTLGHAGMEVIDSKGDITDIPGREVEVSDVTGAGDTAIAVLTLEYLRTKDIVKAAFLANYACSLVVQKRGTAVVTTEELNKFMEAE